MAATVPQTSRRTIVARPVFAAGPSPNHSTICGDNDACVACDNTTFQFTCGRMKSAL